MNESARQSGRTTRMLLHALALAKDGKQVWVVAYNESDAVRLRRILQELDADAAKRIKVQSSLIAQDVDWELAGIRGVTGPVLWDHLAIEAYFRRRHPELVNELERWEVPAIRGYANMDAVPADRVRRQVMSTQEAARAAEELERLRALLDHMKDLHTKWDQFPASSIRRTLLYAAIKVAED